MPLRAFALTIDRNLMHGAEVADAQLGPAISFGRAIPSRLRTGGMLWSGSVRASSRTNCTVSTSVFQRFWPERFFTTFKPRMIPALPMQHKAQPIGRDRDDDLLEDGP